MEVPIQTLPLFPRLDQKLLELLRSLSPDQWNNPTLARLWTVKDIASHLLDGNIRSISILRDGYFGESPGVINSYQDLVDFLNRLNADWVKATKRLSPSLLIELLEVTGKEYCHALTGLDPFKPAVFAVDWAGQKESPNWFHIAREYTEKWHHQQQIREAVNKPGIMSREFFFPLIDTFMQALPHTFRNTEAAHDTTIRVHVTTEAGGEWALMKTQQGWQLQKSSTITPAVEITLDPETAWKLFTKGMSSGDAEKRIKFSGNIQLGKPILSMLSVMA